MGCSFRLAARDLLQYHSIDRIAPTMDFVNPVMEHWLEWEILKGCEHWRIDPTTHHTMSRDIWFKAFEMTEETQYYPFLGDSYQLGQVRVFNEHIQSKLL